VAMRPMPVSAACLSMLVISRSLFFPFLFDRLAITLFEHSLQFEKLFRCYVTIVVLEQQSEIIYLGEGTIFSLFVCLIGNQCIIFFVGSLCTYFR
jgi:hypothetical protein